MFVSCPICNINIISFDLNGTNLLRHNIYIKILTNGIFSHIVHIDCKCGYCYNTKVFNNNIPKLK